MNEKDFLIARQLKEILSSEIDLVDFKVFGSRARGDSDEDSDMDIFIEVESLDQELKKKCEKSYGRLDLKITYIFLPLFSQGTR